MPVPALHLARLVARTPRYQTAPFGPAKTQGRSPKGGTAGAPSRDKHAGHVVSLEGATPRVVRAPKTD